MASASPPTTAHEHAAGHRQPGDTCAQEATRPGSQGTSAVRGTWWSEGEAGRHLRTKAGHGPGTPSLAPVPLRLERIATQAQQYPDMACTTLAHHLDVAMRNGHLEVSTRKVPLGWTGSHGRRTRPTWKPTWWHDTSNSSTARTVRNRLCAD